MQTAPPTSAGSISDELRRILTLAWPVVLGQIGSVTLGTVDAAMAGHLGEEVLAPVALGNVFSLGLVIVGMAALRGLDPIFSQAWGRGDHRAGRAALSQAILLSVLISLPLLAVHGAPGPLMRLLRQPEDAIVGASQYVWVVAPGVVPAMVFTALTQFLQGMGRMKAPMVAVAVGNVVNILLDWLLMYGPFGLPQLGPMGCGLATTAVRVAMLLALIWLCRDVWAQYRPTWSLARDLPGLRHMLVVGLPVGVQFALEVWAFNASSLMMGALGSTKMAAHAIALNLAALAFMLPFGMGAAAATRVGNLVGAGQPWLRSGWLAVGLGSGVMALTATLFLAFPAPLTSIFTTDPGVSAIVLVLLPFAAAFALFDGIQATTFGVLRGAGDTRFPAMINLVGYWCVGMPMGAWLAFWQGWEERGIWAGLVISLVAVSMMLLLRLWRVGKRGAFVVG